MMSTPSRMQYNKGLFIRRQAHRRSSDLQSSEVLWQLELYPAAKGPAHTFCLYIVHKTMPR